MAKAEAKAKAKAGPLVGDPVKLAKKLGCKPLDVFRAQCGALAHDDEKWAALADFLKALGSLPHLAEEARGKLLAVLGR